MMNRRIGTKISMTLLKAFTVILVVLAVLEFADMPDNTYLWREINNGGHIPLFGIVALVILELSKLLSGKKINHEYQHYLTALLCTLLIGMVVEFRQILNDRDFSFLDILRDFAGAVLFLGLKAYQDIPAFIKYPRLMIGICILFVSIVLMPVILWSGAYLYRAQQFPIICSFESYWERKFVSVAYSSLEITPPPQQWANSENRHSAALQFNQKKYSGLWINEPYPDWRGYQVLRFEILSEMDKSFRAVLRVHDFHHNNRYTDRFNQQFLIQPGINQIQISLADIEQSPKRRVMDMGSIAAIGMFTPHKNLSGKIYIDDIRLE